MAENFERTDNLIDYRDKSPTQLGAHSLANKRELLWHSFSSNPGSVGYEESPHMTKKQKERVKLRAYEYINGK